MSDWFQDPHTENTPVPQDTTPPTTDETPAAPAAETPAPEAPAAPETTPPSETGNAWNNTSWNSPATPVTPPTPPTPPTYSAPVNNGWQTPPQGGYHPPQAPYGGWTPQPPTPQKPPKKRRSGASILIAVLAVVCVACLGTSLFLLSNRTSSGNTAGSSSSGTTGENDSSVDKINDNAPSIVTADPEEEGLSSRDIVAANLNSTVIIKMYDISSGGFFQTTGEETEEGEATGIIWTADGYIITNAHCVYSDDNGKTFDRIEVELYDGTIFENATIVGYDTITDLAVLKVDATDLTPASFGDSDALALGDRVLALGNNSGLGWSVTQGVVSGLARDVYEETNYAIKCLQVDAVINPGNSGGPLLNGSGQVIAINSAKIVAEGYEGLGFSIPINEASEILEDLVTYGYVKGRIMLGIEGYTFNRYTGYEGFYISAISSPSSFSGTSVQVGDIITHINGTRVKSYAEMREQITSYSVGDQVTVTLIRINRNSRSVDTFDVTITLLESDGVV